MKKNSMMMSQKLMLIVPHLKVFIRDQASLIRPYFNELFVLMPMPYFSSLAIKLPYIRRYFDFLKYAIGSRNGLGNNSSIISPKFLTLPIEELRKRNCYLASRSCIKTLSKEAINFDLMHAHFLDNGFIGAALKNLYDKPLVMTAHGGDLYDLPFKDKWYMALAKYVLSEADQVIAVSEFIAKKLLSFGIQSKKLHIIPNGYNEELFKPRPLLDMRKLLGLPLNKKVLLSVGNLVGVKGHTYAIDAMRIITRKRNDVILVIVGSGQLEEELRKKARVLGLGEKVLFIGQREHEEIPMWMNACDVFILPSLCESFGVVIIEAMACGKPVVGTCVGSVPEIIRNSDVGLLAGSADPASLSEGILIALDRRWVPSTIINNVRQYTWANIVSRICEVYHNVL